MIDLRRFSPWPEMLAEGLLRGKRVVPVRSGENVLDPTRTAIGIERCDHLEAVRARMGAYRLPWLGTSATGDVVAPDRALPSRPQSSSGPRKSEIERKYHREAMITR